MNSKNNTGKMGEDKCSHPDTDSDRELVTVMKNLYNRLAENQEPLGIELTSDDLWELYGE